MCITLCITVADLRSVVVSVRIPQELKEKLDKLNINVSEVVRSLLEKYIKEVELERLREKLKKLNKRLAGKVDASTIAILVREDRSR